MPVKINFYYDYKSPFSFLGKNLTKKLESHFPKGVQIKWYPNDFNMRDGFGLPGQRSENQWRKVKYAYHDVRRFANETNVKIYGPQKAFNSTLARYGGIFLLKKSNYQSTESFIAYSDFVFEQFFLRKLDIENINVIKEVLQTKANLTSKEIEEFENFINNEGEGIIKEIDDQAAKEGVFGSPTWVFEDGEVFFGQDRIDWVIKKILQLNTNTKEVVDYQLHQIQELTNQINSISSSIPPKLPSNL